MCTLVIGRDVVAPRSVIVAANRDEDPLRLSAGPGVLAEAPRVVGSRDRVAGGTWLAVRERRALVALLNRRGSSGGPSPPDPSRRSRGLLTLDVATVAEDFALDREATARTLAWIGTWPAPPGLARAALARTLQSLAEGRYAPFSLVFASPAACWLVGLEADGAMRVVEIPRGWHVLTHMDLDDPKEPRTVHVLKKLAGFRPDSFDAGANRLGELLRSHGADGTPPVCLHDGPMVTVSASLVWLADGEARYLHAEGRPCEHPFLDVSRLLAGRASTREES